MNTEAAKAAYTIREIARADSCAFWLIGSDVYRVPSGSNGLDSYGCPLGRRWECTLEHWKRFRAVFDWAKDVA